MDGVIAVHEIELSEAAFGLELARQTSNSLRVIPDQARRCRPSSTKIEMNVHMKTGAVGVLPTSGSCGQLLV